jgi:uncharacterized membrane protein YfcA
MDIIGYAASILIGVSLGLIGGGGSILTVPVLVYLFKIDVVLATTYSLFIVGITSIVGSFSYLKRGLVDFKTVFVFGIPSIAAVFISRAFIVPAIPQEIFSIGNFIITNNVFFILLFAVLMIFASKSMMSKSKEDDSVPVQTAPTRFSLVILQGVFVGFITGLVGAGGGFLIIPVLIKLLRLTFKKAIGTSLIILAINSLLGFSFSFTHHTIEWVLLLKVLTLAISGVLMGAYLSKKINSKKLKMGVYVIIKEIVL